MLATLVRGEPQTIHIAATADVVPGDLMIVGDTPYIAINRCASGSVGAFAIGGGTYKMTAQTSTGAPVAGKACNYDGTNVKISTATGKNLGICLSVSSTECVVFHNPDGTATA